MRKTVKEASPNMQLWVGEAGGAFNSGRREATGCFASSFWYLDEMATMAAHGHQARPRLKPTLEAAEDPVPQKASNALERES